MQGSETPMSEELWKFDFSRVPEFDRVVEARFHDVHITDRKDVETWEAKVRELLAQFGYDLILLINLGELRVHPRAGSTFGAVRSRVLADYAHISFRYGGDAWTRASINTSYALHGADSNLFATRDEALEAIREYLASLPARPLST